MCAIRHSHYLYRTKDWQEFNRKIERWVKEWDEELDAKTKAEVTVREGSDADQDEETCTDQEGERNRADQEGERTRREQEGERTRADQDRERTRTDPDGKTHTTQDRDNPADQDDFVVEYGWILRRRIDFVIGCPSYGHQEGVLWGL